MASSLFHMLAACLPTSGVKGQGLIEYALIMILVAVVLIVLLVVLGPGLGNIYSTIVLSV